MFTNWICRYPIIFSQNVLVSNKKIQNQNQDSVFLAHLNVVFKHIKHRVSLSFYKTEVFVIIPNKIGIVEFSIEPVRERRDVNISQSLPNWTHYERLKICQTTNQWFQWDKAARFPEISWNHPKFHLILPLISANFCMAIQTNISWNNLTFPEFPEIA